MGLRDWLAGNVAGPSAYGSVMGREAVKNGIVLGRTLYLSHGTRPRIINRKSHVIERDGQWVIKLLNGIAGPFKTKEEAEQYEEETFADAAIVAKLSDALVFIDGNHMRADGFELYVQDPIQLPSAEDFTELFWHTRAVGIAFCVSCCIRAAENFMKESNARLFNQSLGSGAREELVSLNTETLCGLVNHYVRLPQTVGVMKVIDVEKPGVNDFIAVFLAALSVLVPGTMVGFQQGGELGFGATTSALAEETLAKVSEACQKFHW